MPHDRDRGARLPQPENETARIGAIRIFLPGIDPVPLIFTFSGAHFKRDVLAQAPFDARTIAGVDLERIASPFAVRGKRLETEFPLKREVADVAGDSQIQRLLERDQGEAVLLLKLLRLDNGVVGGNKTFDRLVQFGEPLLGWHIQTPPAEPLQQVSPYQSVPLEVTPH